MKYAVRVDQKMKYNRQVKLFILIGNKSDLNSKTTEIFL